MSLFLNDEELNKFVLDQIEKKLEEKFRCQFDSRGSGDYTWGEHVRGLIVQKFVDKYVSDNYVDLVAKIDTDKILKLIEAKAAVRIIAVDNGR